MELLFPIMFLQLTLSKLTVRENQWEYLSKHNIQTDFIATEEIIVGREVDSNRSLARARQPTSTSIIYKTTSRQVYTLSRRCTSTQRDTKADLHQFSLLLTILYLQMAYHCPHPNCWYEPYCSKCFHWRLEMNRTLQSLKRPTRKFL